MLHHEAHRRLIELRDADLADIMALRRIFPLQFRREPGIGDIHDLPVRLPKRELLIGNSLVCVDNDARLILGIAHTQALNLRHAIDAVAKVRIRGICPQAGQQADCEQQQAAKIVPFPFRDASKIIYVNHPVPPFRHSILYYRLLD